MRRGRPLFALTLLATVALILPVPIPAEAEPTQPTTPQEYVVGYTGATAAAESAIEAAGGQVVDVNEDLKIAKVSSTDGSFVAKADRASDVTAVVRNHAVGTSKPGLPHRFAAERPSAAEKTKGAKAGHRSKHVKRSAEPLSDRQWDMDLIGVDRAHKKATGRGVDVGIIDTGIDASHPDLAKNFDRQRSRNFTQDIPAIDGPCEVSTCIDAADTDDGGHGTHVAGTVAADDNRLGIGGVAPDAKLINLRAGQDSGYFFLYETVAALTAAGDMRLDVVNMSFYTDPWLYNCASKADYLSGTVSDAEIAEQAFIRQVVLSAVTYASDRGVTLVGAAGNQHTDLAAPTRSDASSPDYPPKAARERTVTDNCLSLPNEAPQVISVSSVGPSTTKADYSSYGLDDVEVAAPGGWFRDGVGTPSYSTPGNMILSSYPVDVAIEEGLADENGTPVDDFSVVDCNTRGVCGFYTYLQGTSMASPHAAGVAALIIDRYGRTDRRGNKSLAPGTVRRILENSATDTACPTGGTEIYTDEGRPADWNAVCEGTTDDNGLYGEGIINAARAVASRGH